MRSLQPRDFVCGNLTTTVETIRHRRRPLTSKRLTAPRGRLVTRRLRLRLYYHDVIHCFGHYWYGRIHLRVGDSFSGLLLQADVPQNYSLLSRFQIDKIQTTHFVFVVDFEFYIKFQRIGVSTISSFRIQNFDLEQCWKNCIFTLLLFVAYAFEKIRMSAHQKNIKKLFEHLT